MRSGYRLIGLGAAMLGLLTGCQAAPNPPASIPTASPLPAYPTALLPIILPSATATLPPTPSPTPSITPSPTPRIVDYQAMINAIDAYLQQQLIDKPDLVVGVGFVDIETGQTAQLHGEEAHYSLSTFKGPLGAFYLWLLERGDLAALPSDAEHLIPMLNVSSNPDTTCVIKRVGGLPPFNDWLAQQGMTRERNFVFRWQNWGCEEDGSVWLPDSDWRYANGDAALGLPGSYALLRCLPNLACDKVFSPLELAQFYARLYRGEIIGPDSLARWLEWMEKSREGSALLAALPPDPAIHAYAKNGYRATDAFYPMNFYNEAGIIRTPHGAYAIAIFMHGHPDYPGTDVVSDVARIAYEHFTAGHGP